MAVYESKYGLTQSHSNFIYRMSIPHKRNVLSILRQRNGRYDKYSNINVMDMSPSQLFEAIASYSYDAMQEAHINAMPVTESHGYGVWQGRGRTPGAKNKQNRMIDIVDVNVKNISGSNIQRAIENNTSTNNTNEIEIDAKIEALISSFEKSIDNELKEYVKKETFDYTNTKINHTINELRSNFTDEINKLKNDIILSKPTIVKIERHEVDTLKKIDLGIQHKKFPQLCRAAAARLPDGHHLNIWLYGPAGTGKSTAGQNLAQALGREFVSDGKLTSDFQVLGYKNTQGDYVRTKFRDAYEFGYVYMADEIDGSLPDALIGFNGGLANHVMAFPDQMIKRHRNFIFIGAANTTGTGGTIEYVGRMKQDAAFNNRFIYIDWPIDDALEEHMAEGEINWLNIVRRVRANVASHKITGHLVTPRATLFGATLIRSGFTVAEAAEMTLKQGLSNAQWKLASQGIVL